MDFVRGADLNPYTPSEHAVPPSLNARRMGSRVARHARSESFYSRKRGWWMAEPEGLRAAAAPQAHRITDFAGPA
jgi:hypothetical protein